MKHYSTKTYGNDRGFSCAFRQPKATHSHCSLIHGYSLGFKFVFESDTLDDKNWVYDFGNCKWIKKYLEEKFDHTLAIDKADPKFDDLFELKNKGLADVVVMDGVGCEKFAEHVYNYVAPEVAKGTDNRVKLTSVEVFEHGANSAIYSA
jgi:6-pyruvoyltetrahydropterin/6-carboxytetrahydropterin synthase